MVIETCPKDMVSRLKRVLALYFCLIKLYSKFVLYRHSTLSTLRHTNSRLVKIMHKTITLLLDYINMLVYNRISK